MASELEAAAVRLRRAGQDDLARELAAGMRRGVAPVPDKILAGLAPHLPNPYAATLDADLDIKTIARSGSANTDAVVSVYATTRGKARKLKRLDAGLISHPLFGDREHWYTQEAPGHGMVPGWFTGPCEAEEPRVRDELERALRDVSAKAGG